MLVVLTSAAVRCSTSHFDANAHVPMLVLQVRNSLQGQPIPRHLLNDHSNPPTLDMAFAATPDLAIRAQSHCTR